MSSNLVWELVTRKQHDLSDELKFALRGSHGASIHAVMDIETIPYLTGLRDAGIKDAEKLIAAIEKYGEIEVKEIY